MGIFSDINYETVIYTFLALVAIPIAISRPLLIIYLLVISMMFPVYFDIQLKVGPVNIYLEDLILAFYFFMACYVVLKRLIAGKNIIDMPENAKSLIILVLVYITLHVLFMFAGLYQGLSAKHIIRRFSQFSGCLFFFFPLLFVQNKDQLRRLLVFIVILALFYPLWQIFTFWNSSKHTITSSGTVRLAGDGMPLIACALFALLIYGGTLFHYLLSVFPIIAIILKGHRSMFLALAMSFIFFILLTRKITKSMVYIYVSGLGIISVLIIAQMFTGYDFVDDFHTRAADSFNNENKTSVDRTIKIKDNIFAFVKKPLVGIGYNYEMVPNLFGYPRSKKASEIEYGTREYNVLHPHNFALMLMSHTGAVGTFLVFSIISLLLKKEYLFTWKEGVLRDHGAFFFCSTLFFIITALMNDTFVVEGEIFWILTGTSILLYKKNPLKK